MRKKKSGRLGIKIAPAPTYADFPFRAIGALKGGEMVSLYARPLRAGIAVKRCRVGEPVLGITMEPIRRGEVGRVRTCGLVPEVLSVKAPSRIVAGHMFVSSHGTRLLALVSGRRGDRVVAFGPIEGVLVREPGLRVQPRISTDHRTSVTVAKRRRSARARSTARRRTKPPRP